MLIHTLSNTTTLSRSSLITLTPTYIHGIFTGTSSKSSNGHFPTRDLSREHTRISPALPQGETRSCCSPMLMRSSASRPTIQISHPFFPPSQENADKVIRIWLFHCHIEFHVMSGFSATIIEAPEVLVNSNLSIPHNHYKACQAYPMEYRGNAAGNTHDPLNLTGTNTEFSTTDYGYALCPCPTLSIGMSY